MDKLFVIVTTPMGMWLGVTQKTNYDSWFGGTALVLENPKNLIATQSGPGRVELRLAPLYLGGTIQKSVAIFPTTVELLGQITKNSAGNEICSEHTSLFSMYSQAVQEWKAAQSGLYLAKAGDIPGPGTLPRAPTPLRR